MEKGSIFYNPSKLLSKKRGKFKSNMSHIFKEDTIEIRIKSNL